MPEQFSNQPALRFLFLSLPLEKHFRKPLRKLGAPLLDLIGMDAELRSDLIDLYFSLDRLHINLVFECYI
jgi:hypothetical protein